MSSRWIRLLRYALLATGALMGVIVTLRALFGPFSLLVRVNRPLNAESWFGLAFAVLMFMQAVRKEPAPPRPPKARAWYWALGVAVFFLAVAAFWSSRRDPFLSDDYIMLRLANTFQRGNLRLLFTTGGGDGFFRPLPYLSAALTARWASYSVESWHLWSLVLHGMNAALVYMLASRLGLARWGASLGALLFAIHGSRPEDVVWVISRFDLLATFFVVCGLILFLRYRATSGWKRAVWASLTAAAMLLGMLSKESAYVFPLLVLWLIFVERDFSRPVIQFVGVLFVLAAAMFVYRWSLFGGIGGYKNPATGQAEALSFSLLQALKALLLRIWAVLCFPVNWSIEPSLWLGVAIGAGAACLLWLARTRSGRDKLAFPLGFVMLAALPPVQQLLIGEDLQKSRLLYLPSIGFCLLVAAAWEGLAKKERIPVALLLLVFQYSALDHNLAIWSDVAVRAQRTCAVAASCVRPGASRLVAYGVPNSIEGVYFFANGLEDCVSRTAGRPVAVDREPVPPQPPSVAPGVCSAIWDAATASLRCVP